MRTMRNSTSALRFIVDVRCDTRFRDKSGHKVARSGLSGKCENGMTNGAFVLSCPIRNVAPKQIFSRFWNGRRRSIAFLSREKKNRNSLEASRCSDEVCPDYLIWERILI